MKNKLSLLILLALPPMTYAFLRFRTLGQWGQESTYLAGSFLKTQLGMTLVYRDYFLKFFFPWNLRVNYMGYDPFSVETKGMIFFSAGILVFLIAFIYIRSSKELRTRLSFFLLTFLPIANLIPMMQWEAERFLYFPLFFFVLLLEGIIPAFKSTSENKIGLIFTMLLILIFGVQTYEREKIWQNDRTLGLSMLASNPNSYHGLVLALDYNRHHELHKDNIQLASEYLKNFPNELLIYDYLTFSYIQTGEYDQAHQIIQKGLTYFPKAPLLIKFKEFLNSEKNTLLQPTAPIKKT